MMRRLILFITFIQVQVLLSEDIEIVTKPDKAKVFISESFDKRGEEIGLTPYKNQVSDFYALSSNENFVFLTIVREGHEDYHMVLNKSKGADLKLSISLKELDHTPLILKHDLMISKLFEAQRLIRAANHSGAQTKLDEIEKDIPGFSVVSEMMGINYYLSGDMEKALSRFRDAFGKNPKNQDAFKMKEYLEKKLGVATK